MTIGAIGNVGGPIYIPETNRANQVQQVDYSQVNTQDYVRQDTETIRPVEDFQPDTGERPDFAAINLMRNSFPEPVPMQTYSLEDFETGAPASGGPQMTLEEFQAQQAAQAQVENTPQNVNEAVAENSSRDNTNDFSIRERSDPPLTLTQETQVQQQLSESAMVQTTQEIAQENAGNQLTPAQQQGVQEYERVQSYADPVSVTMAAGQNAA